MKHGTRKVVGTAALAGVLALAAGCGSGEDQPVGQSPHAPDQFRPGDVSSFLKVDDPRLRAQVARNLGAMGRQARPAVPELRKLLDDADPDVRQAAEEALEKIRAR